MFGKGSLEAILKFHTDEATKHNEIRARVVDELTLTNGGKAPRAPYRAREVEGNIEQHPNVEAWYKRPYEEREEITSIYLQKVHGIDYKAWEKTRPYHWRQRDRCMIIGRLRNHLELVRAGYKLTMNSKKSVSYGFGPIQTKTSVEILEKKFGKDCIRQAYSLDALPGARNHINQRRRVSKNLRQKELGIYKKPPGKRELKALAKQKAQQEAKEHLDTLKELGFEKNDLW